MHVLKERKEKGENVKNKNLQLVTSLMMMMIEELDEEKSNQSLKLIK